MDNTFEKRKELTKIKLKYEKLREEEKERRKQQYKKSSDKIENLHKEMIKEMQNFMNDDVVRAGKHRVVPFDGNPPQGMKHKDIAWTIHLGEVVEIKNIVKSSYEDDYILAVDKLADLGLSFKTKKQAEEYLRKLKRMVE